MGSLEAQLWESAAGGGAGCLASWLQRFSLADDNPTIDSNRRHRYHPPLSISHHGQIHVSKETSDESCGKYGFESM